MVADDESALPYARDFFRLTYPAAWSLRENRLVGLTDFTPPVVGTPPYPPGVSVMTLPETGMPLDLLLRSGLFFLLRDLDEPVVSRQDEPHDDALAWVDLTVHGSIVADDGTRLYVTKQVALIRPGPGVLLLALYGETTALDPLRPAFDALRRSLVIVS